MKLTDCLSIQDVKEEFKKIPMQSFDIKKEILAQPLTKKKDGRVGTAFDYLLRFYLKYLNPQAITHGWVAESSLEGLKKIVEMNINKLTKDQRIVLPLLKDWYTKGKEELTLAKERYTQFLETGQVTDNLIKSTLYLSKLDSIYRAGYIKANFEYVDKNSIKDLKNLISIVKPELFKAKKVCILNPIFKRSTVELIVIGDADLVIDDMVIDIKTTIKLQNRRDYYHQLIGYYILYKIKGIVGMPETHKIKKLGLYFSRHSILRVYDTDYFENKEFSNFIDWFKERTTKK